VEILTWIFQEKKLFQDNFSEILCKPGLSSTKNMWNFALLSAILFRVRIALKKFTQVLSYVVCTQVRSHVHKQITKRRYGEAKPLTFCFGKTSFVHSRSGTYHALLFVYFGLKFLPDVRHCVCWVLAEIWALDSSHKIGNKFLNHHCQGWKEGSFVCETVWFSSWVNTHPFDLKFVAFCPKFSGDSYMDFLEKNYFGTIFQKFWANLGYPPTKLVKFRPTFCNFIPGSYCADKIHTSTFICCLHPGEEARP